MFKAQHYADYLKEINKEKECTSCRTFRYVLALAGVSIILMAIQ